MRCLSYQLIMEASVFKWLQYLRNTVDDESESWNLCSVCCDSILDSTIDNLFDFDSTTSTSDFEYYSMDQSDDGRFSFITIDDDDQQVSDKMSFLENNASVAFKSWWPDVEAWKNELMDSALDGTSSEDEQVSHSLKKLKIN